METLGEILLKAFTRYFIPGLVFLTISIGLPGYLVYGRGAVAAAGLLDGVVIAVLSAAFGYLLDSVGAYRWHLHAQAYRRERKRVEQWLRQARPLPKDLFLALGSDPDRHDAILWLRDEKMYDRIFQLRAEWVAILESAFALLVGSLCLAIHSIQGLVHGRTVSLVHVGMGALLAVASYSASRTGIHRMVAHNIKLAYAVQHLAQKSTADALQPNGRADPGPPRA
jgi:hypothetical protein